MMEYYRINVFRCVITRCSYHSYNVAYARLLSPSDFLNCTLFILFAVFCGSHRSRKSGLCRLGLDQLRVHDLQGELWRILPEKKFLRTEMPASASLRIVLSHSGVHLFPALGSSPASAATPSLSLIAWLRNQLRPYKPLRP